MAPINKKGKSRRQPAPISRKRKRGQEEEELAALKTAVNELDPRAPCERFQHLPLSRPTADGLRDSHFFAPTDVQARAIPLALKGSDILAAAKTGSGKTLAFLIPVLERLHRAQWTEFDGLGALILSPTRELAAQTFEVLRKVGRHHPFSAGMIIGGRSGSSLKEEVDRIGKMDILVCTPGRLLQHMDHGSVVNVDNLQILVLDEADRIMDLGFQRGVDALVEHLPKTRQTMLFSATQTKKVSDLARLSLQDPEYISVHEAAAAATPSGLQQQYIVVPLPDKIDTLWSFLQANCKKRVMVFLSSCKQVRFVYESFRRLRGNMPLLHLHGRQKQYARLGITKGFSSSTKAGCLLSTDVVARGIDFPAVDWVVQVDCPEDVDTYIHRVGRTARYDSKGRAMMFLDPSEEVAMVEKLEHRKIPITKANVKEKKKKTIKDQLQQLCFENRDVNQLALTAFANYTRSIQWQNDRNIFNLEKLDLDGFSKSLGLASAPSLHFQKGENRKTLKNAPRARESDDDSDLGQGKSNKKDAVKTKVQKMLERTNQDVLSSHYRSLVDDDDEADDDAEFFSKKRILQGAELAEAGGAGSAPMAKTLNLGGKEDLVIDSKRREKLLTSKKKLLKFKGRGQKLLFDDDGNPHAVYELRGEDDFREQGPAEALRQKFVGEQAERARAADGEDKAAERARREEKKAKRKARERGEEEEARHDGVQLVGGDGDEEDPLALLRSLPIAGEDGGDSGGESEEAPPPRKKAKQDKDKKSKKQKHRVIEMAQEPGTVEDLEALAVGLLDD